MPCREPFLSVVIPAYNEAAALPATLEALKEAIRCTDSDVEVLIVDDGSTDDTIRVAEAHRTLCVSNPGKGVSSARNFGARSSHGSYLLFLDADVIVARWAIKELMDAIARQGLMVGAPTAIYLPQKLSSWLICAYWDWKRLHGGSAQGVAQFYERNLFEELGGYDEQMVMSEDFDLYIRARNWTAEHDAPAPQIVRSSVVWPSTRRYDSWSAAKMLFFQNPVISKTCVNSPAFWTGWRDRTIR